MNVSATSQLTPQMVTASALRTANDDGDGRTGAAALNDGDAAAHAAAQQARTAPAATGPHSVDVKA